MNTDDTGSVELVLELDTSRFDRAAAAAKTTTTVARTGWTADEFITMMWEFGRRTSTALNDLARAVAEAFGVQPRLVNRAGPHSFRPDYDLACTVPRCHLTPEEHP